MCMIGGGAHFHKALWYLFKLGVHIFGGGYKSHDCVIIP
jgi:hypothetical protein